jgi:hypothetical protein
MSEFDMNNIHPAAGLMPEMLPAEFEALKDSIRERGQRESIKLLNGLVLDGRHRFRACCALDLDPRVEHLPADTDAISYVLDMHTRRDLTTGQRAMIAQAAASMRHGGLRRGDQEANLPLENSLNDSAEKMGVSRRSAVTARKIEQASPEIAEQVKRGEVTLNAAKNMIAPKREPDPEPKPKPKPSAPDDDLAEMVHLCEQQQIELELLRKVVESDDSMREAIAEIKMLRAKLESVADRIAGAENTAAQARLDAQNWRRKHDALLKKVK